MKTLQDVFAENFARDDIEGAKRWLRKWKDEQEQVVVELVQEGDDARFSVRAMCGHLSDYLEGYKGNEPESYDGSDKTYLGTKYGQDLFWSF